MYYATGGHSQSFPAFPQYTQQWSAQPQPPQFFNQQPQQMVDYRSDAQYIMNGQWNPQQQHPTQMPCMSSTSSSGGSGFYFSMDSLPPPPMPPRLLPSTHPSNTIIQIEPPPPPRTTKTAPARTATKMQSKNTPRIQVTVSKEKAVTSNPYRMVRKKTKSLSKSLETTSATASTSKTIPKPSLKPRDDSPEIFAPSGPGKRKHSAKFDEMSSKVSSLIGSLEECIIEYNGTLHQHGVFRSLKPSMSFTDDELAKMRKFPHKMYERMESSSDETTTGAISNDTYVMKTSTKLVRRIENNSHDAPLAKKPCPPPPTKNATMYARASASVILGEDSVSKSSASKNVESPLSCETTTLGLPSPVASSAKTTPSPGTAKDRETRTLPRVSSLPSNLSSSSQLPPLPPLPPHPPLPPPPPPPPSSSSALPPRSAMSFRVVNGQKITPSSRICHQWARDGTCTSGLFCRFEHDKKEEEQRNKGCCRRMLLGKCRGESSCPYPHLLHKHQMPICVHFLNCDCVKSAEECGLLHVKYNNKVTYCRSFNRGCCTSYDECAFQHRYVPEVVNRLSAPFISANKDSGGNSNGPTSSADEDTSTFAWIE